MTRALSDRALLAYLEGEVTASEAAEIERHLGDARWRRRLDELRELLGDLAAVPPDRGDVAAAVAERIEAGLPAAARRRRPVRLAPVAAGLAVAAAAAVAAGIGTAGPEPDGEVARAPEPAATGPAGEVRAKAAGARRGDRWVALDVYRVTGPGGEPSRVRGEVGAGDGLLFAYRNATEPPFDHLAVFAVGPSGQVFWYYPDDGRGDPRSVAIDATDARAAELPDLVRHDLPAGALSLYGVFTREPLEVSAIEALVGELELRAEPGREPPRLPIPRSGQHRIPLEVTR